MNFEHWAAAKVKADGTDYESDDGVVSTTKMSTGVYQIELANALGTDEIFVTMSTWRVLGSTKIPAIYDATLAQDDVTVIVEATDPDTGSFVDVPFCVHVERFSPT